MTRTSRPAASSRSALQEAARLTQFGLADLLQAGLRLLGIEGGVEHLALLAAGARHDRGRYPHRAVASEDAASRAAFVVGVGAHYHQTHTSRHCSSPRL